MCGGEYVEWEQPKHLTKINGECIVARTIRLLKENNVKDIAISSNNDVFKQFGVPVLKHTNDYYARAYNDYDGYWHSAFYLMDKPVCYVFGDVVFSPEAIKTIVNTRTQDIQFFASAPPFAKEYPKPYVEPFALKVQNTQHLKSALKLVEQYDKLGMFARRPLMWEVWQVTFANKGKKFCSGACSQKYRRENGLNNTTRTCVVCGKGFITDKYGKAITCSRSCANRYKWAKYPDTMGKKKK